MFDYFLLQCFMQTSKKTITSKSFGFSMHVIGTFLQMIDISTFVKHNSGRIKSIQIDVILNAHQSSPNSAFERLG